jgi:alcohol dehydrogenase YqhD (iron-dependent ADH family)
MPLPTPDQLIELQRRLNLSGSGSAKKYGTVDKVQNALRNQLKRPAQNLNREGFQ